MSHFDSTIYTACLSSGGLAINAGGAATVKTVNTCQAMWNGQIKAIAAASAIAFPTLPIQPASSTWLYLVTFKFSDASVRIFGPTELLDSAGTNLQNFTDAASTRARLARVPDGFVPVGVVKVVTNSSTTFTPGTTALDAAGLTVTYFNLFSYPVLGTL